MITIGALTIGSLYWGNGRRQCWRNKHLDCAKREYVKVPIRYGRRSSQSWRVPQSVGQPSLQTPATVNSEGSVYKSYA